MADPKHTHIQGDLNISAGLEAAQGLGSLYLTESSGILDVEGRTYLDQTDINTTDGALDVSGTNAVTMNVSAAIQLQAAGASYLQTTSGSVNVQATAGAATVSGTSASMTGTSTTATVTGNTTTTIASLTNDIILNSAAGIDGNATTYVYLDAASASHFTVTGSGTLQLDSTAGKVLVSGGTSNSDAVDITATNGGIDMNANTGYTLDVTNGGFSIDGNNVASNITLATTTDNKDLTISVTGASDSSLILSSSGTGQDALIINASSTTGGVDMNAGTFGILADTTGPISLGAAAASNFTVTGAFDLSLISTAGSTIISGGEAAADAVQITASDVAGGVDINAGTGGITADTTAGISLDAEATSNFTVNGGGDLTLKTENGNGRTFVWSDAAVVDAVRIYAPNTGGGIDIDSGTGGITMDSTAGISIDAAGAASNFSLQATGAGQDLTIGVTGVQDSSLVLSSTGTSATDAIIISATAGGIDIDSTNDITIDTTDLVNGIHIATGTAGVPVTIGTGTSLTTIAGDLLVSGLTTTINTETLTVEDNLIIVNSANGELGADGGMVIRRHQTTTAGDVSEDTIGVVSDAFVGTPATSDLWTIAGNTNLTLTNVATGTFKVGMVMTGTGITGSPTILSFSSGSGGSGSVAVLSSSQTNVVGSTDTITGTLTSAVPGTLTLATTSSAVDDHYNGWWIKITSGAQNGAIRRIKDYVGSTKVATLYITADNAGSFIDGLDLAGAPAPGDTYELYNSPYIASFYDESSDRWVLAYSSLVPDPISSPGPSVVNIQRYVALDSGPVIVNPADPTDPSTSTINVNVINEQTFDVGVTIEGVVINNGLINGVAPDVSEIVGLPANANTAVDIVATATEGSYMVLVDRVQAASGASSFLRQAGGAYAVFAACSSGQGGGINRLVSTRGTTDSERIECTWTTGNKLQLKYQNNRSVAGTDYYRVKIQKVV